MSPLYRSKRWLTLAQLVPAWATELADATTSARKCERQLWDSLLDDIINGRFDGKVPGLAVIGSDKRAVTVKGKVQPPEADCSRSQDGGRRAGLLAREQQAVRFDRENVGIQFVALRQSILRMLAALG